MQYLANKSIHSVRLSNWLLHAMLNAKRVSRRETFPLLDAAEATLEGATQKELTFFLSLVGRLGIEHKAAQVGACMRLRILVSWSALGRKWCLC